MNKYIIVLLAAAGICFGSCSDNKGEDESGSRNSFRVTRVSGDNAQWGPFELLFYYSGERLDSVYRRNTETRDTLGRFTVKYENTSNTLSIVDYVLNIDADSVARLQKAYPQSYTDSLRRRRVSRTLYTNTVYPSDNYSLSSLYRPREDVGTGEDFNNSYVHVSYVRTLWEYDNAGRMKVLRRFVDTYVQDELNTDYDRAVDKYEFTYSGNGPSEAVYYVQDSYVEESWREMMRCAYTYSGSRLSRIEGNGYSWDLSGTALTITDSEGATQCTVDANGNITSATLPDGSTLAIEYEAGHSNLTQLLYPPDITLLGKNLLK